jgi:hypothetical protein
MEIPRDFGPKNSVLHGKEIPLFGSTLYASPKSTQVSLAELFNELDDEDA